MKAVGNSGVTVERDDAMVYEFRGGAIARLDYFNNRADALQIVQTDDG